VGTLAAEVAHEIKTPMALISVLSESLADRFATGRNIRSSDKEKLRLIKEASERVTTVLTEMLSLSRRRELRLKKCDVNSLVKRALYFMMPQIKVVGVHLTHQLGEDIPLFCVDPEMIHRVLMNIISNAIESMPDGGLLEVKTGFDADETSVIIKIRDSGRGMSPEEMEKMFEPFFTTKEGGKGSGLGMPLSYDIIDRHGGEIRVESEAGHGTTVAIRLPVNGPVNEVDCHPIGV